MLRRPVDPVVVPCVFFVDRVLLPLCAKREINALVVKYHASMASMLTTTSTVQAEFKPERTYTWNEQLTAKGINMNIWLPNKEGPPARWEVVDAQGNNLTVRMHFGEVVFNFQDENSFLVNYPETAKASGKIACRRSGTPKE